MIVLDKKQVEQIFYNSYEIASGYYNTYLVFENCRYKPGQVVQSQRGSQTLTFQVLEDGYYTFTVVGGGGSKHTWITPSAGFCGFAVFAAGGGSGGAVQGVVYLHKNVDYVAVIGGRSQNSSFYGNIGYSGANATTSPGRGGGYTVSSNEPVIDNIWNKTGNRGGTSTFTYDAAGGASVYNGWGAGNSGAGGFELKFIDKKKYTPIDRILTFNINIASTITIDNVVKATDITTYAHHTSFGVTSVYSISAIGYNTNSGSYKWTSTSTSASLNITMQKKDVDVIFTIECVDQSVYNPTIVVNGTTLSGNTYTCKWGDTINYTINNEGYKEITGTATVIGDVSDDTKMFITETMERDTVQLTVYDKYFNRYVGYEVIDAFDETNIIEPFKNVLIEANTESTIEVPAYTILRYGINRGNRGQVYDFGAQERYTVGTQDNDTWAIFREYVTGRKVEFFIQDVNADNPWTNQSDLIGKEYTITFFKGFVDNFTLETITGIYDGNPIEIGEVPNTVNINCNISDDQFSCNEIDYIRDNSRPETYIDDYTYQAKVSTQTIYFTLHNETDTSKYDYRIYIDNPYWTQSDKEKNSNSRRNLGSTDLTWGARWGNILRFNVESDDYKDQTVTVNTREIQQNEVINVVLEPAVKHTFTIVPTPVDATVLIDDKQRTSAEFKEGREIPYTVQASSPYKAVSGTYTMGDADYTLNVELKKVVDLTLRTFNFNGDILTGYYDLTITSNEGIENKHIEIEAQETTIEIPYEATVDIIAVTEECGRYEETLSTLTTSQTKVIAPDKYKRLITATCNVPATIQIDTNVANNVTTHSAWVNNYYNYSVFYRGTATGYITKTGNITDRNVTEVNIVLEAE